jgi:hypothetical protein
MPARRRLSIPEIQLVDFSPQPFDLGGCQKAANVQEVRHINSIKRWR